MIHHHTNTFKYKPRLLFTFPWFGFSIGSSRTLFNSSSLPINRRLRNFVWRIHGGLKKTEDKNYSENFIDFSKVAVVIYLLSRIFLINTCDCSFIPIIYMQQLSRTRA